MPKQKPSARKLNDRVVVLRGRFVKYIPVVCKTSHTLELHGGALKKKKKNPEAQATPQTS